jgi:AcrR family transcriptional regulator
MTENLTSRQKRAIMALLSEPTVKAAADRAGLSRETLYSYLSDAGFRAALTEAQSDAMRLVTTRLAALLERSLDVIGEGLGDRDAGVRLRAASVVLRHVAGLLEYVDLVGRVELLERGVGGETTV